MDSKILLGKILQRFSDLGISQVEGYNGFKYLRESNNSVFVGREQGKDTPLPFKNIIIGIKAIKSDPQVYDKGPNALREFGITHITSPIWSLLHLLSIDDYKV
ncbi:MAG: hypothetical protein WBB27_12615 [Maribacter sp.]